MAALNEWIEYRVWKSNAEMRPSAINAGSGTIDIDSLPKLSPEETMALFKSHIKG